MRIPTYAETSILADARSVQKPTRSKGTSGIILLVPVGEIDLHEDWIGHSGSYPNFSFTNVKIAVAMLTTIKVAIARQTASDSVNFQIARMHRTVQTTRETVITRNAIQRTSVGFTTPLVLGVRGGFSSTTTSGPSVCGIPPVYQPSEHLSRIRLIRPQDCSRREKFVIRAR